MTMPDSSNGGGTGDADLTEADALDLKVFVSCLAGGLDVFNLGNSFGKGAASLNLFRLVVVMLLILNGKKTR